MDVEFTNGGVRYRLVATRRGRRECELTIDDIKPDYSMWTSKQKRRVSAAGYKPKSIRLPGAPIFKDREYACG